MADNDNKELMDFLGKQFQGIEKQFESINQKFDGIDKRFEGIEKRLDNTATKDDLAKFATKDDLTKLATKDDVQDLKRHTGVLFEALDHKIDIVIEGLMGENERLERHKEVNEQEHSGLEKRTLINTADIAGLDQRVGRLESRA